VNIGEMRGTLPWMAPELFPLTMACAQSGNGSAYEVRPGPEQATLAKPARI
jgi:hypothetical protein